MQNVWTADTETEHAAAAAQKEAEPTSCPQPPPACNTRCFIINDTPAQTTKVRHYFVLFQHSNVHSTQFNCCFAICCCLVDLVYNLLLLSHPLPRAFLVHPYPSVPCCLTCRVFFVHCDLILLLTVSHCSLADPTHDVRCELLHYW